MPRSKEEAMPWTNLTKDLNSILNSFVDLIGCDGGAIYTLESTPEGVPVLVFKAMVNRSVGIHAVPERLKAYVFKLDSESLVGKTGLEQKVFKENYAEGLKTADGNTAVHQLTTDILLQYNTQNILSAPLLTPRGDLVGVVQLVNKIPTELQPNPEFSEQDERLCAIVSGQAALAIENSKLLIEQQSILDGFVNACVTAIEARDPVTSGHSQRVCDFTIHLAEKVNKVNQGELALIHFTETQLRELRYAAMLHDIGKISVKEDILKKEKKLFPWELELVEMRFKVMRASLRAQLADEKHEFELAKQLRDLDKAWQMILAANEPTVLPKEVSQTIVELTQLQVQYDEHQSFCALTHHEKDRLCIPRGSLSTEERIEIEKHVSFTYEILKMVPWSRGLENVPHIAHRHHEKLDGTGYPLRVPGPEIPIQSRMLTICDIFDALTSKDRPYKAAVPIERALKILEDEVNQGKLDGVLYKLFVDSKAWILPSTGFGIKKQAA